MIINGFGGGVADALGLKVVQPGTTLYNNGFASGFSIGNSAVTAQAYYQAPSGTWLVPAAYGVAAALINQPLYLVPLRGKNVIIDWFSAYTDTNKNEIAFGFLPYNTATMWNSLNPQAGVYNSYSGGPAIGTPVVCRAAVAFTVYTAYVPITEDMVFGYIGMIASIGSSTDRGYIGANNIRISS